MLHDDTQCAPLQGGRSATANISRDAPLNGPAAPQSALGMANSEHATAQSAHSAAGNRATAPDGGRATLGLGCGALGNAPPAPAAPCGRPAPLGIDDLIDCEQFAIPQAEKEKALVEIFRPQLSKNRFCGGVDSMYGKLGFCEADFSRLAEIPFIPVSMFKMFDLITCERERIVRVLRSSATTTGTPSRVYLDKETAFRQSKALTAILKSFLGTSRRPFLVIDCPSSVGHDLAMSARGAAIMGVSVFARGTYYAFRDDMTLDTDSLEAFCAAARAHGGGGGGGACLAFGFTYIIWTKFLPALKSAGLAPALPGVSVLHSGGWKKLVSESVDKAVFSDGVARALGTAPERVLDFYGMAEQTGVVFIDCECGNKHAPCFADIVIRDFLTLAEAEPGGEGLIEVMSALPTSYPGQAVLTEDVGVFLGVDDCPCGRRGKYFRFKSRVEKAEIRGCGDTLADRESRRQSN
jgi:hypothetical protein